MGGPGSGRKKGSGGKSKAQRRAASKESNRLKTPLWKSAQKRIRGSKANMLKELKSGKTKGSNWMVVK